MYGIAAGQIIGRWGTFNCEAFGEYTNNLRQCSLPVSAVQKRNYFAMWNHVVTIGGVEYIQYIRLFYMKDFGVLWFFCFYSGFGAKKSLKENFSVILQDMELVCLTESACRPAALAGNPDLFPRCFSSVGCCFTFSDYL